MNKPRPSFVSGVSVVPGLAVSRSFSPAFVRLWRSGIADVGAVNVAAALRGMVVAAVLLFSAAAWAAVPASNDCTSEDLLAGLAPWQQSGLRGAAALMTDQQAPPDGARWDAPAATQFDGASAGATYDLGAPRRIGALVLQADANDTYRLTGSIDGAPDSFRLIAEVANVVDRGPGLRTRAVQVMPVTARYLRIAPGEGDGFFSIGEWAVYCQAPTPFPPKFPQVEAPLAGLPRPQPGQGPGAAPELTAAALDMKQEESSGRTGLILIALALLVVGVASSLTGRRAGTSSKRGVALESSEGLASPPWSRAVTRRPEHRGAGRSTTGCDWHFWPAGVLP